MKRLLTLGLASLALSWVPVQESDYLQVMVGRYGPRNEVRITQPTFKWEIWPASRQVPVESVDFQLDGRKEKATYDTDLKAVIFKPAQPLKQGSHKVEIELVFQGGFRFKKDWATVVAPNALSRLPSPDDNQRQALEIANSFRARLSLPPMEMDDRLNMAAVSHSKYLSANKEGGHHQVPGKPSYLAVTPPERVAAYGWVANSWEDVASGSQSLMASITGLFEAPYHRIPFMQPGKVSFGAGFEKDRLTLEFGSAPTAGDVISPADGETNVPLRWTNYETPNPMRVHGNQRETGYPIVLAHFDGVMGNLDVEEATLTTDGVAVPVLVNSRLNDIELTMAAIIFPEKALKPNTTYTAKFVAKDTNRRPLILTSTFRTGKR